MISHRGFTVSCFLKVMLNSIGQLNALRMLKVMPKSKFHVSKYGAFMSKIGAPPKKKYKNKNKRSA